MRPAACGRGEEADCEMRNGRMGVLRALGPALLTVLLALCLGGCRTLKSVDDLYALPALPEEYSQLQQEIQTVMDERGAEYSSISNGSNTATVQLLDLDGDGFQESAAVFLRVASEEKPLQICLFRRRTGDDTYRLAHTIQGSGQAINSVAYEDLNGDGSSEIVVSWQIGTRIHTLSAYEVSSAGVSELMSTGYNEGYLAADLDRDGRKELIVFQQHSADGESNRAEYYRYRDSRMVMTGYALLSDNLQSVTASRAGLLADGRPGVYVTCTIEGGVLTDILTAAGESLRNVTRDPDLGVSQSTIRYYTAVDAVDINRDGVQEIPVPVAAPSMEAGVDSGYYFIHWRQFDSTGVGAVVSATYHSVSDGWYFSLPGGWLGSITVARDDSRALRGERSVVFYYWPDQERTEPVPFLTIYKLTGDNRYSRAESLGRFILKQDSSTIYCASLTEGVWDCGLDSTGVARQFSLITSAWSGA